VFVLAVVLDVVYQIIAEHFVYPGEAITVAIVLALVPYLILRGLEVRTAIFVLDQGPIYKPSGSLIGEAYSYTGRPPAGG
jgi:hypothetical protein